MNFFFTGKIATLSTGTPVDLSVTGTSDSPGNRPDVSGPVSAKIVNGQGVVTGNFGLPPVTRTSFTVLGAASSTMEAALRMAPLGSTVTRKSPNSSSWISE